MSDVRMQFDTSRFEAAFGRLMEFSRRDVEVVMREQIRGFVRTVADLTPPNRGGRRGQAAKRAGEAAVEGDIRNAFEPVHPRRADITPAEMPGEVKRLRSGGKKRIRVRPQGARKASRGDITRLVREKKRGVGFLAGAWLTASSRFGSVRAPAWMTRHQGRAPGWAKLRVSPSRAVADIANAVRYASGIDRLPRRVQAALDIQAKKMNRRAEYFFQRRAQRAGLK